MAKDAKLGARSVVEDTLSSPAEEVWPTVFESRIAAVPPPVTSQPVLTLNQAETIKLLRYMGARGLTSPNLPALGTIHNCDERKQLHLPPDDNDGISFHVRVCCESSDTADRWSADPPPPAAPSHPPLPPPDPPPFDAGPEASPDDSGTPAVPIPIPDAAAPSPSPDAAAPRPAGPGSGSDAVPAASYVDAGSSPITMPPLPPAPPALPAVPSPGADAPPTPAVPAPSVAKPTDKPADKHGLLGCSTVPGAPPSPPTLVLVGLALAVAGSRRRRRA